MTLQEILLPTVGRWLGLLALAVLVGSFVLELVVLPRDRGELGPARRRLGAWIRLAVAVLIVTWAGDLLARARTMNGGDMAQAMAALPLVLTRTHFGEIWIARAIVLALLAIASAMRSRWSRRAGLGLALGVALSGSLSGHAADWGDLSLTVLVDWLHAVAATAWTGGLFGLVVGLRRNWGLPADLIGDLARRFSRLAGYCLVVVVASGVYNAWVQVPTWSALWSTTYGNALLLKIALALVVALVGAVNRYRVLPRLAAAPSVAKLSRLVGGEAAVAVVVFGCTALLGESTPKMHESHMAPAAAPDDGGARVTMEALHAGGGVPKGWMFAPPAGDAAKGREVFARLGCFGCHAVAGEGFPRPSQPGPSLSDVGRHHPAGYLFESVVNPNAVVVEAPGYTGADGRSIMPDYRDRLSVRELIDLIAYLKSLRG